MPHLSEVCVEKLTLRLLTPLPYGSRLRAVLAARLSRAKPKAARSLRAGEVGLLAGALDINDKKKPNEKLRDFSPPS